MAKLQGYGRQIELTDSDLEYILNALRLYQEDQMRLAREHQGEELNGPVGTISISDDLFLGQYKEVTDLREKLVDFCGHDLTEDGI